jgi:hypothetical protein
MYHLSHSFYIPRPTHPPWFDHPYNIWWRKQVMCFCHIHGTLTFIEMFSGPYSSTVHFNIIFKSTVIFLEWSLPLRCFSERFIRIYIFPFMSLPSHIWFPFDLLLLCSVVLYK